MATVLQYGMLPLHYAVERKASEAVVAALLAVHLGAAKEKDNVRPPRILRAAPRACVRACALSLAHRRAA